MFLTSGMAMGVYIRLYYDYLLVVVRPTAERTSPYPIQIP